VSLARAKAKQSPKLSPCRVAPLAEVVEGLAREMRLFDRHWFDRDANAAK
jgi:hypothetical protein